jgi:hypothetical protein
VCREGLCGKLAAECERFLVAFSSFPRGSEAAAAGEILRERAMGNDLSWFVLQARSLLRVFDFYKTVKPALDKKRREAFVMTEAPVMSREEWLMREKSRQVARRAWFAGEEAALVASVEGVARARELLTELSTP